MKRLFALGMCCLFAAISGCANEAAVEGKVSYKGAAVADATVVFQTEEGNTIGTGVTDANGVFKLKSPQGKDKVPGGKYKVLVSKTKAVAGGGGDQADLTKMAGSMMKGGSKNELPEKYAGVKTTPLSASIPSKEAIEFKLD